MYIEIKTETGKKELDNILLSWNTALEACQLNPELALLNNIFPKRKYTINIDYRNTLFLHNKSFFHYIILRQLQFEGNEKYKFYMCSISQSQYDDLVSFYDVVKNILMNNKYILAY